MSVMVARSVELAVAALASLPERDQDRMGRQLLTYIERLLQLRVEIDRGSGSFEPGAGEPLDIEDFLRLQNERHGTA
jgi:hypothetical protein